MIRIELALRFALVIGLGVPALARAQDGKPAQSLAPAPGESTAQEVVTTPAGETIISNRSINIDPTSAAKPAEAGDDPARPKATPRNQTRTIFRTAPQAAPGSDPNEKFRTYFDHYTAYQPRQVRINAPALPIPLEPLEGRFGIKLAPVDDVLRSQLEIAKGQGVVVVEVKPGSLGEQAGLKPKDVLLNLGEKPVSGVGQARSTLLGLGKEALEVKLIREGKPRRMSLVGPEHGSTPESSEFWIGVPVSPVDAVLRSHLTELPAEDGLIANDVVKDSPADKAGVKKYDILVSMGGKPLKSSDSLIAQVQASGGKAVPLVILRAGKPTTVEVTPTRRAHPTVISLTPGHQSLHYEFFQPNVAIEVQKKVQEGLADHAARLQLLKPGEKRDDIQIELFTNKPNPPGEGEDAKIAAQLKELTTKVDGLLKAIEGLKKPEGR